MSISEDLKEIKGWNYIVKDEIKKDYFKKLEKFLDNDYEKETI